MREISLITLILCPYFSFGQETKHRFKAGESLTYSVYYYFMGIWVSAGEVTFSVNKTVFNNKACFEFKGHGTTHPRYDWFYKVDDTYISYASIKNLQPFEFKRKVSEGGLNFSEKNKFDYSASKIYCRKEMEDEPVIFDTLKLEHESFDVLTMLYHTRNLNFEEFNIGDKIPIKMAVDGEINNLYLRYLGKEFYDHEIFGRKECNVFSALLVEGTIFKGGEHLKVWVTDDQNAIPIYVQSEIRVGSIRSELKTYSNIISEKSFIQP